MELNEKQQRIVDSRASKIVVCASAASGKTATLVARLKRLLQNGEDPSKIVAITFTNNAAAEILERLNKPKGLFVGTVHSYANQLLLSYGIDTSDVIENEQFDKLFNKIKKHPGCIKPVDHLLLDEAQDSTPVQFEFLLDMVQPKNWLFVGDWRQSLYGWAGADPQYLLNLTKEWDVVNFPLNDNYRNDKRILDFAKGIIRMAGSDYLDRSNPMSEVDGKVVEANYDPILLARYIKEMGHYKDWFVLARTNEQVDTFAQYLEKEGVPHDTFKRSELNNAQLVEKMQEDTVKVLTIHASKGLEANNVAVIGAKFYNIEEKCVSYVAATRARHLLMWMSMPNKTKRQTTVHNWET